MGNKRNENQIEIFMLMVNFTNCVRTILNVQNKEISPMVSGPHHSHSDPFLVFNIDKNTEIMQKGLAILQVQEENSPPFSI